MYRPPCNPRAMQFADDSGYKSSKMCLSGTRKELIDGIMGWCENVDHDWQTQIILLIAIAGAGKSAMAHTMAHLCAKRGILLSSFYF